MPVAFFKFVTAAALWLALDEYGCKDRLDACALASYSMDNVRPARQCSSARWCSIAPLVVGYFSGLLRQVCTPRTSWSSFADG
jgi:hypothetical protein